MYWKKDNNGADYWDLKVPNAHTSFCIGLIDGWFCLIGTDYKSFTLNEAKEHAEQLYTENHYGAPNYPA